jgi:DnaJ-class molecular chaperone
MATPSPETAASPDGLVSAIPMNYGAHTPGPWMVHTQEHPHHLGGKHIETQIFCDWFHPQVQGNFPVVTMSSGIGPVKGEKGITFCHIRPADARLIAAAPDLLAALQLLLSPIEGLQANLDAAKQARAAVARATGKETSLQPDPCPACHGSGQGVVMVGRGPDVHEEPCVCEECGGYGHLASKVVS